MWPLKFLKLLLANFNHLIVFAKRRRRLRTQTRDEDVRAVPEKLNNIHSAHENVVTKPVQNVKPEPVILPIDEELVPEAQHEEYSFDSPSGNSEGTEVNQSIEPIESQSHDEQLLHDSTDDDVPQFQTELTDLVILLDPTFDEKPVPDDSLPSRETIKTSEVTELTEPVSEIPQKTKLDALVESETDLSSEHLSALDIIEVDEDFETQDGSKDNDEESEIKEVRYDEEVTVGVLPDDRGFAAETKKQPSGDGLPRSLGDGQTEPFTRRSRTIYYSMFIAQRSCAPELTEQEVDVFLNDLETENLGAIFSWPPHKLENYFFNALQRYEFVGELPMSNQAFMVIADYIRRNARIKGKIDHKRVPPVLFLISMVFCARYSESDARNFWEPYASQVWGLQAATQSFQQKCRKHFVNCREDMHQVLSLHFNYQNAGDVVRPVYQHAIIPSYLQGSFAEWLVNDFEAILQHSAKQLPLVLQGEKSLDYMPRRLRDFIRSEETKETAARLIIQMSNAIKLFHETEQSEAVESVMSSTIERSLWEVIYKKLISDQSQFAILRRFRPRLEWCWDLEADDIFLNLSNIRSDQNEKPDSVTWAENDAKCLNGNDILVKVYPWEMGSGDWEVDPVRIPAKGPLNGSILVLSEDFDLDKDKQGQENHIIFERNVPALEKPIILFRVNPRRKFGVQKEQIDSDGSWIIASNEQVQITDKTGKKVQVDPQNIPYQLWEAGFRQAGIYSIQLPVTVHLGEKTIEFEGTEDHLDVNPYLKGTDKVSGLSSDIPPVFLSPKVYFLFSIDSNLFPLRRTWLSLRRNGKFLQSILLADLFNQGKLKIEDNLGTVDLESFLQQPGAYSLNLLHNIKPLLDEPIQFSWLPDNIKILRPDPNSCYSPSNPLQVKVKGIPVEQILPFNDEKCKIAKEEDIVTIEWRNLRSSQCRFAIHWKGSLIHFCWNIDRVSAWIEGGGDKNQVLEGQEQDVVLQVRGQPQEEFSWMIDGSRKQRKTHLNARGEFISNLLETEVRDMLLEDSQAISSVLIAIHGYRWKLFDYLKTPEVKIIAVSYQKPKLNLSLELLRKIRGTYVFQVRRIDDQSQPEILTTVDVLDDFHVFSLDLIPGVYRVEILLDDVLLHFSPTFQVEEELGVIEETDTGVQIISDFGSPEHLFRVITASKRDLLSRSYDGLPLTPAIEQLQLIHTPEEWITDSNWDEGFKRLLPSWAVLMYPLRFTTKNHRRILHIFPEQVAYGGRAGKGYAELKLEEEKMRVAASWRPGEDPEFSVVWMGVPQKSNIKRFCELDQLDLWPAYLCNDCGRIVASRDGTYLKLPPSIIREHQHGQNKQLKKQFIDTVYGEHIAVSIKQYKEKQMLHSYWSREVIFKGLLQYLIDGKISPANRDLEQPINLYSNQDYGLAVSELYERLQHPAIEKFMESYSDLDRLSEYFHEKKTQIPAFSAMSRLSQYVTETRRPQNIPGDILSLSMVLRLKAHHPQDFSNLLDDLGIRENKLHQLTNYAVQGCPKMLEWSVAWSELFYIHAIS